MSDRQLQLIDGAAPPRPTNRTPEIVEAVAQKLLPELLGFLGKEGEGASASVLADIRRALDREWDWDGYRLTRALDWEGCSALVDIMNEAHVHERDAMDARLEKWVNDYDVKPKLVIGASVKVKQPDGREVAGEIHSIDPKRATYTVNCPELGHIPRSSRACGTIGIILAFEKVESNNHLTT